MDMTVKPSDSTDPARATATTPQLQPFLHDACVVLCAPSLVVSRQDGQLTSGADGFYHNDRRILSVLEAEASDVPNTSIAGGESRRGADRASFRTVLRGLAEHTPDPAVVLERHRGVEPARLTESVVLTNAGLTPVHVRLRLRVASDLASMEAVKSGEVVPIVAAKVRSSGLGWADGSLTANLTASPVPDHINTPAEQPTTLHYDVHLDAGARWEAELNCTVADTAGELFYGAPATARARVAQGSSVHSADRGLDQWFSRSCSDLAALLLTDPQNRADTFLAAGAPWFLTLFGRDSIWAARMMLPLGTEIAAGTLRALARRQGGTTDPATEEQPGKILHEVRSGELSFGNGISLPPSYYGTVDATPLWVILLHDAWRWGMASDEVEQLLDHAESALGWMRAYADRDGFLKYVDQSGHGLSNQGWKDSADAVRHRDGRLAQPPVALCEVQAYAYEAAVCGAALLRAFDRPGADAIEEWADTLRHRFRARFWLEDAYGPYPSIALDRTHQPLDAVASNMGHLLGSGLLDARESEAVAARLTGPDLDSGFGLRTLAESSTGYNPLGYHIGSVWPHDTAIAVHGLVRAGLHQQAEPLVSGLVASASAFEGRMPELFAGHGSRMDDVPSPYPAACRPQAWAAASSVLVVQSLLGLDAHAPDERLTVNPKLSSAYRPLHATGLRFAGQPFDVSVASDGSARTTGLADNCDIRSE